MDSLTPCTRLWADIPLYLAGKTVAQALLESLDPAKPIAGVTDVRAAAEKLPDNATISRIFPPRAGISRAGSSVLKELWNECRLRHAWMKFANQLKRGGTDVQTTARLSSSSSYTDAGRQ